MRRNIVIAVAILGGLLAGCAAHHLPAPDEPVARITESHGEVEVRRASHPEWRAAHLGTELYAGDRVRVGSKSSATIEFASGTESIVTENKIVLMEGVRPEREGKHGSQ